MPTVHRFGGLRVVVYPNDHRPAHVHVVDGSEAVFDLNCPEGPVELRENYGFRSGQIAAIEAELNGQVAVVCREWSAIHGGH
ncbi:MAG TPA: DUF4160 domain-containing protein [Caulobacteraceae bacterium]